MRDGPQLTSSQRQAVHAVGHSVLVSAAAGTGKTHVLAERCAHLVCDAKSPCDVDRLLVVTFTEAAAAEMRERIGLTIRRRLEAKPNDGRLRRQLALLDAATITTIHAFCLQLVRRWFARLDLDPDVEVIDADEADLIRQETLESLFADLYERCGEDETAAGFRRLVDVYGMGRDQRIARMVLDLHTFVQSLPDPSAWLREACSRITPGDASDLPAEMAGLRREILLGRIEMLGDAAVAEVDLVGKLYPAGQAYAHRIDRLVKELRGWWKRVRDAEDEGAIDEVVNAIAIYKDDRVASARGLDDRAKQERDAAREMSDTVQKRFVSELQRRAGVFRSQSIVDGLGRIGPHVAALAELTSEFGQRYQAVKQAEGRVDFGDLERFALDLLSADAAGSTPSEAALQVQDQFDYVLVDEFQDVNPVQDAILRLVSRETDAGRDDNLFAVGDVKQSIYRFRLAEPDLFVHRAEAFAPDKDAGRRSKPTGPSRLIWLQENFRSRGEVLEAVNAVFERIMRPQFSGLAYDERARLKPGAPYPDDLDRGFGRPAAELHLIEKEIDDVPPDADDAEDAEADASVLGWDAVEREALLAGQRILELTGKADGHEPAMVCDKNPDPQGPPLRPRPIELRDIVILLRATTGKANHFERVLRNMGVAVYADLSTGYFTSLEVQDVLSLLHVIDNARQDIPLAAVLRSPLLDPALTESQMVEIRLHAPGVPFHEAVQRYADDGTDDEIRRRLRDLFERLDGWRGRLRRQPLSDVLWQIMTETGYWAYVGGLRNGLQRRANLVRLHERARQFARFARQGLHRFLRFIEQLDRRGRDFGVAPAVSEAENVVRIMSIHRSKGLEFPVVILPDLGKQFNLEDTRRTMLFDRKRFLGLPVVDLDLGVRYPTLSSLAVADEIGRQIRAEEMRILYVAMTRAREHLILIGTTPLAGLERQRERGRSARDGVRLVDLAGATAPLDWLVPAVASMPDDLADWPSAERPPTSCSSLFAVIAHDVEAVRGWSSPEQASKAETASLRPFADLEPADAERTDPRDAKAEAVIKRITQPYRHASLGTIPAVVAASEMKRRFAGDHERDERRPPLQYAPPTLHLPRFAVEAEADAPAVTPAERGTLMHLVLQHLDLGKPCDVQGIAQQVDEMVTRGLLSEPEKRSLSLESLAWLFTTELGQRLLRTPDRVQREVPFVLGIPPDRVVPGLERESDGDEVVLVRGMIDCVLRADEGDEVIDFKTDAITRDQLSDRVDQYRPQIEIYAEAVRRIWQRPVTRSWLAFLTVPETVEVHVAEG